MPYPPLQCLQNCSIPVSESNFPPENAKEKAPGEFTQRPFIWLQNKISSRIPKD